MDNKMEEAICCLPAVTDMMETGKQTNQTARELSSLPMEIGTKVNGNQATKKEEVKLVRVTLKCRLYDICYWC